MARSSLSRKNTSSKRFKKIGLITKLQSEDALQCLWSLLKYAGRQSNSFQWIAENTAAPLIKKQKNFSKLPIKFSSIDQMASYCDLLVAIGGDGTILRAARYLLHKNAWKNTPLLGVNAGHLGFLSFVGANEAAKTLDAILNSSQKTQIEERSCLKVVIERKGRAYRSFDVLNDCVLSKGSLSRIFEFHVVIDGEFLSSYRADGLIASSPTGSTAYNLAAGGSIIAPNIPAIQLTPICAQMFSNKPIVISDSHEISLSVGRHSSDVFLTLDGHTGLRIEPTDKIKISKSSKMIRFLRPPGMKYSHYFHSLRQKLKWGLVSKASA